MKQLPEDLSLGDERSLNTAALVATKSELHRQVVGER